METPNQQLILAIELQNLGRIDEAAESFRRILEIEKSESEPVETARRGLAHVVVDCQPAIAGLNGRRAQPNLVCIPPCSAACLKHHAMATPMPKIGRV